MARRYARARVSDLPDLANLDYLQRINRAIDHVTRNLAQPLPLEQVARVACFSPHHFHRVFRAVVGETLLSFVKRLRLERALYLMSHNRGAPLTDVALRCGFASSSDFSRSFRNQFGVPPSVFDVDVLRATRRGQLEGTLPSDRIQLARLPAGHNPDGFTARMQQLPARRVAYVQVTNPFGGERVPAAAARIVAWAKLRGLAGGRWLGYQWEDPEIVPLELCRYHIGLELPATAEVAPEGEISVTTFPAMTVAEVPIVGSIELELRALDWLYATWLPRSGFVPDHQPCFEAWGGEPFAHGLLHFELRLQLAVTRAQDV